MSVELINIGTELMLGHVVNTNASFLSQRLNMIGLEVAFQTAVGDRKVRLASVLNQAMGRSNIIILTGGLGPTQDDITKKVLANVLGKKILLNKECLQKIKSHFYERRLTPPSNIQYQALVFKGARIIVNRFGTAPGQILDDKTKTIIILPGVPREMKVMMDETVIPYLREKFPRRPVIKSKLLKVFGLSESALEDLIKDISMQGMNPEIGTVCTDKELIIRLTCKADSEEEAFSLIKSQEMKIRKRVGGYIFGQDEENMEKVAGALLTLNHKNISIAESCTGGRIGDLLTDVPGSSRYFDRSIVCYSNRAKEKLLGIPENIIRNNGAASHEVCGLMAKNVRKNSGTDIGLSITGIAGPGGGTPDKPVGIAFIGLDYGKDVEVKEHRFKGPRKVIKEKMAYTALDMVRRHLIKL
jgi:nicotinamide-nucleotide amidase